MIIFIYKFMSKNNVKVYLSIKKDLNLPKKLIDWGL